MPRIRSLKPEHRQHRKVGKLSDFLYRLWVGMVCEADDEGRLVADADQLRVLVFGYFPKVTVEDVEAALQALAEVGLIRLYTVAGVRYAELPSWRDHQRIDRPTPSKLPAYEPSAGSHGGLPEPSASTRGGSEGIGREGKGSTTSPFGASAPPVENSTLFITGRPPSPAAPPTAPEAPSPSSAEARSAHEPATSKPAGGRRGRAASDDAFEVFYARYPKKVGPRDAQRAWARAVKTAPPAEILAGLERQLPDLEARERRFRKDPAGWLNGGHWADASDPSIGNGDGAAPTIPPEWLHADGCPRAEYRDRVPSRHPCPLHRDKGAPA